MKERRLYEDVLDDIKEIVPDAPNEDEEWVPGTGYAISAIILCANGRQAVEFAEKIAHVTGAYAIESSVHAASGIDEVKRVAGMFSENHFGFPGGIVFFQFSASEKDSLKILIMTFFLCNRNIIRVSVAEKPDRSVECETSVANFGLDCTYTDLLCAFYGDSAAIDRFVRGLSMFMTDGRRSRHTESVAAEVFQTLRNRLI